DERRDEARQPLPAMLRSARQRVPAAFDEVAVGCPPAARGEHVAVLPAGALAVAARVQRREHAGGELAGLFQDGRGQLEVGFLATRQGLSWSSGASSRSTNCMSRNGGT